MDRGAWCATVHGIAKSWIWLKWLRTGMARGFRTDMARGICKCDGNPLQYFCLKNTVDILKTSQFWVNQRGDYLGWTLPFQTSLLLSGSFSPRPGRKKTDSWVVNCTWKEAAPRDWEWYRLTASKKMGTQSYTMRKWVMPTIWMSSGPYLGIVLRDGSRGSSSTTSRPLTNRSWG